MSTVDLDKIATDAMDFVDRFCEVVHPNNPEAKSALRQEIVGHVVAYLKDDSACDYEISKRVLTQTWEDYKPRPQELSVGSKTIFERVQEFYSTSTYDSMRTMLQTAGTNGRTFDISQREIKGAVLAYVQHYNLHNSFSNFAWKNHLLAGRNLSEASDDANNKILREAAMHVLSRQANHQNKITEPAQELLEQILNILTKAHQYRHNLAAALIVENTPELSLAAVIAKRENVPALIAEDTSPLEAEALNETMKNQADEPKQEQDEVITIEHIPEAKRMKI